MVIPANRSAVRGRFSAPAATPRPWRRARFPRSGRATVSAPTSGSQSAGVSPGTTAEVPEQSTLTRSADSQAPRTGRPAWSSRTPRPLSRSSREPTRSAQSNFQGLTSRTPLPQSLRPRRRRACVAGACAVTSPRTTSPSLAGCPKPDGAMKRSPRSSVARGMMRRATSPSTSPALLP